MFTSAVWRIWTSQKPNQGAKPIHLVESSLYAFNKLTQLISEPPLLRYYNLKEEVTIETDANDYGLVTQ